MTQKHYDLCDEGTIVLTDTKLESFCRSVEAYVDAHDDPHGDYFEVFANTHDVDVWNDEGYHDQYKIASFYTAMYFLGSMKDNWYLMQFPCLGGHIPSFDDLYTTDDWEEDGSCLSHILRVEYNETMDMYSHLFANPRVLTHPALRDSLQILLIDYRSVYVNLHDFGVEIFMRDADDCDEVVAFLREHGYIVHSIQAVYKGMMGIISPVTEPDGSRDKSLFTSFKVFSHDGCRDEILYLGIPPVTLQEAFWKTMAKWRCMRKHPRAVLDSAATCGLCTLFIERYCRGCPIAERGFVLCNGSPFEDWERASDLADCTPCDETIDAVVRAIDAEITFLTGLAETYNVSID
jgi:hypothetical protein